MTEKEYRKKRLIKAIITVISVVMVFIIAFAVSNIDLKPKNGIWRSKDFDCSDDFVRIIDVGQGDSILIYSNGYSALIDTGLSESSADVLETLELFGIKELDALLLTHYDYDHIGGLMAVTDMYRVKNFIMPKPMDSSESGELISHIAQKVVKADGKVHTAVQGMNFKIGEFEITVLASYSDMGSENDRSVVTAVKIDKIKFLLMGDAEAKTEKLLLKEGLNLNCDILKVAHHGSSTSSKDEFLKAVTPKMAAISVGRDNGFGHPHGEVISDLEYRGAKIYRTDLDGDITFSVKDGEVTVNTEK